MHTNSSFSQVAVLANACCKTVGISLGIHCRNIFHKDASRDDCRNSLLRDAGRNDCRNSLLRDASRDNSRN